MFKVQGVGVDLVDEASPPLSDRFVEEPDAQHVAAIGRESLLTTY